MLSADLFQLPPDIEDFTGRDDQAREVARLLVSGGGSENSAVMITTVSGKGGVGKTALALHVAHRVRGEFPDGQLYSNLRGVEAQALDPAQVLAGFLRDLGVSGSDVPEHLEERARMFRARLAGRRVLVVLDNASSEAQVRPLHPGTRGCAVLVTSRSRMTALAGSHTVALDVMPVEHAVELLRKVVGGGRVAAESVAAAEISRLCGCLPLALRVAGARLASRPSWSLAWFADRLGSERHRLDMLRVGDLEVRASFALSYQSLEDAERRAFRLLGLLTVSDFPSWVLAPLMDLDAATAEALVERLVDAELVELVGIDASGQIRYRFHDLLRVFARECLEEAEPGAAREAALRRLLQDGVALVATAAALLQPGLPREVPGGAPPVAVDAVRRDPRNWFVASRAALVAAVRLAFDAGLWEPTWRLAEPLPAMFDWRADWQDWEETQKLALEAAGRVQDRHAEALSRRNLGALYRELGRFAESVDQLTTSTRVFTELGEEYWAARAKRWGEAEECLQAALGVYRDIGDRPAQARALRGLGLLHRDRGRYDDAVTTFEESRAIFLELGDEVWTARALVGLASVMELRGEDAAGPRAQATEICRNAGGRDAAQQAVWLAEW